MIETTCSGICHFLVLSIIGALAAVLPYYPLIIYYTAGGHQRLSPAPRDHNEFWWPEMRNPWPICALDPPCEAAWTFVVFIKASKSTQLNKFESTSVRSGLTGMAE